MRRCFVIIGLVLAAVWFAHLAVHLGAQPPSKVPPPRFVGPVGPVPATPIPPGVPPAPAEPVAQAAPAAPQSGRVWEVYGRGKTENDAQQRALENAADSVDTFLKEKVPDVHWAPKAGYLQDIGAVRVDKPTEKDFHDPDLGTGYEAVAHVDMTDPNLRKMQEKVNEERQKELAPEVWNRHLLVGRILGSFVALFLVVFGYIKLEELTRGYYTTLLRLGAGAVVVLAVAGLFLAF